MLSGILSQKLLLYIFGEFNIHKSKFNNSKSAKNRFSISQNE